MSVYVCERRLESHSAKMSVYVCERRLGVDLCAISRDNQGEEYLQDCSDNDEYKYISREG